MAARSRPRNGQPREDADEERNIWNQVRNDAKRVDSLTEEADVISKRIVELEQEQAAILARGETSSASIDDELESLYRDNVRISEETQSILDGDNNSLSIHKSLQLLAALRDASENDNPSSATTTTTASTAVTRASASAPKSRTAKRRYEAHAASAASAVGNSGGGAGDESAADSPSVGTTSSSRGVGGSGSGGTGSVGGGGGGGSASGGTTGKLVSKSSASRSGSVPGVRESPVRAADEGADGADGIKPTSDRLRLVAGTEVLYRNKGRTAEGEGILCSVTSVTGEGKQRRYEIKDLDPDMLKPTPYRASVSHLVPIPSDNAALPSLTPRKQVLALYPGTTTFYKAEVVAAKSDGKPLQEGSVRLRFEGEDEADREMDVERRYVLTDAGK